MKTTYRRPTRLDRRHEVQTTEGGWRRVKSVATFTFKSGLRVCHIFMEGGFKAIVAADEEIESRLIPKAQR